VRQLLCSGVEIDAVDNAGSTAINWRGALKGRWDIVKILVEAGAQIGIPDMYSQTAIDHARDLQNA
jgi:ankyrin repeat protein